MQRVSQWLQDFSIFILSIFIAYFAYSFAYFAIKTFHRKRWSL